MTQLQSKRLTERPNPRPPYIGAIILLRFGDRPKPVPAIVVDVSDAGFAVTVTAFGGHATSVPYESVMHVFGDEPRPDYLSPRTPVWSWPV